MPRYFFNVYDGHSEIDNEGTELSDIREARMQAVSLVGAIVAHEARHVALGEDWRLEVTDRSGLVLFQIHLLMVDAPATLKLEKVLS